MCKNIINLLKDIEPLSSFFRDIKKIIVIDELIGM